MDKIEILKKFSADSDRYYRVRLFEEEGFERRSCAKCQRYFWTLDSTETGQFCPEDSPNAYSFIGEPPTIKRFDYTEAWRQIESFFVKNNHTLVNRYPVVCRWRDDLFFTIASIVDFQRIMGSKVVFEFPANPLIVPQTCLRFKDLENVGVTGRHFSSFCMVGQHSIPNDKGGYWKDQCIDLDFRLLTERFGINKQEIVFVEDVWEGGGSFGSSLEYFVRGLELGNAVFTEFQGELTNYTVLDQKIIDMGAGLERFAWITAGTPTAYDCCFGPIINNLFEKMGIDSDSSILTKYFIEIARSIDNFKNINDAKYHAIKQSGITDIQLNKIITPLEDVYLVADHLRTLIFAISDGALPSNVGGGYNLRIMLRRVIGAMNRINLRVNIDELVDMHINYLKDTYPELESSRQDIKTILKIETERYQESKLRMNKIAGRIRMRGSVPTVDELITLYESDGITPDYLKELKIISEIPSTFYTKLSELHQSIKKDKIQKLTLKGVPETETLFYKDDPHEFQARVLGIFDDGMSVVLDKTSFYPRGGGQEPDHGTIAGIKVIDVNKHAGGIITHRLERKYIGEQIKINKIVLCKIDERRRINITKNHTSTHILNASSRKVLGSWIWQHSAFKEEDHARLDITHHSSLNDSQVKEIEDTANQMIKEDLPVTIEYFDRGAAEQQYGFRIYQGGVVPVKLVRIVSIQDRDIEACGGTHVKKTGEIKLVKITRTKRIQDGVVRLEFVSGDTAFDYVKESQEQERMQKKQSQDKRDIEKKRETGKEMARNMIPILLEKIKTNESGMINDVHIKNKQCFTTSAMYDEFFHINFGKKLILQDPKASHCGIFESGNTVRMIVYCGKESKKNARQIVCELAALLGGSGGGSPEFAQGGGKDMSKKEEVIDKARQIILE